MVSNFSEGNTHAREIHAADTRTHEIRRTCVATGIYFSALLSRRCISSNFRACVSISPAHLLRLGAVEMGRRMSRWI